MILARPPMFRPKAACLNAAGTDYLFSTPGCETIVKMLDSAVNEGDLTAGAARWRCAASESRWSYPCSCAHDQVELDSMSFRERALLFVVIVLGLGNSAATAAPDEGGPLEIFFIDVQGGAATLIVTPERESILIDSGWPGLEDRDPKRIVHALKDLAGCDHLDHLVTTHWHMDHYGGVEGLARLVRIGQFWDRGLPEDPDARGDFPDGPSAGDPLGKAYRKASAGRRKSLKAGDTLPLKGLKALVLASGGEVASRDVASRFRGVSRIEAPNLLCENRTAGSARR